MDFTIRELRNNPLEIEAAKEFLYNQIKKVYGIGPNIKFHYDIEAIEE